MPEWLAGYFAGLVTLPVLAGVFLVFASLLLPIHARVTYDCRVCGVIGRSRIWVVQRWIVWRHDRVTAHKQWHKDKEAEPLPEFPRWTTPSSELIPKNGRQTND